MLQTVGSYVISCYCSVLNVAWYILLIIPIISELVQVFYVFYDWPPCFWELNTSRISVWGRLVNRHLALNTILLLCSTFILLNPNYYNHFTGFANHSMEQSPSRLTNIKYVPCPHHKYSFWIFSVGFTSIWEFLSW